MRGRAVFHGRLAPQVLRHLEHAFAEHDRAGRVVFAGSTDDVASSYQAMDCFCLPSRTEQMPLSLLEAMASGLYLLN